MSEADELKSRISTRWDDSPAADLSARIVDFLVNTSADELQMLTFYSFSKALGRVAVDDLVIQAVSMLSNSSIHALDVQLMFIDDDEQHYPIGKREYARAKEQGFLVHPETGVEVTDFVESVVPTFRPTEAIVAARRGHE